MFAAEQHAYHLARIFSFIATSRLAAILSSQPIYLLPCHFLHRFGSRLTLPRTLSKRPIVNCAQRPPRFITAHPPDGLTSCKQFPLPCLFTRAPHNWHKCQPGRSPGEWSERGGIRGSGRWRCGSVLGGLRRHVDRVRWKDSSGSARLSTSVPFQRLVRIRLDGESVDGHAARIQVSAVSVATLCSVSNLVPGDACASEAGALRRPRRGMNRFSVALLSIHLVFSIIAWNLRRRLNVWINNETLDCDDARAL